MRPHCKIIVFNEAAITVVIIVVIIVASAAYDVWGSVSLPVHQKSSRLTRARPGYVAKWKWSREISYYAYKLYIFRVNTLHNIWSVPRKARISVLK